MIIARNRMRSLDVTTLFIWFVLYSCIGWLYETIYCYVTSGNLTNRGFLYGPLCPIYGVSILLMVTFFTNRWNNLLTLFLSCSLIATVVEFISSYWMEKIFDRRWWNYADMPLNLNGRICLGASILFGLSGVLFVRFIHPAISRFLSYNVSDETIHKISRYILVLLLFDIAISLQISL